MLLADFVFIWVGGALVIGFFGLLTLVVTALIRMIRGAWRAVLGPWTGRANLPAAAERPCHHGRCGHVNRPGARYCARCGRPLESARDVDRYG